MLLTMPISIVPSSRVGKAGTQRTPSSRLKLRPDAPCSSTTGIAVTPSFYGPSFGRNCGPLRAPCLSERLIKISNDVVDMLDADAEPDGLRPHARRDLLLRRHLAMGRRGRMAGERLGVADIDQAFDQLEGVVELRSGLVAA